MTRQNNSQHRIATKISRRTMLQGIGAAISLPMLDVMSPATASAQTVMTTTAATPRMAYIYFPNGVAKGAWEPAKVGKDGALQKLNRWMKPLESLKEHLIIPTNIWTPRGNGHGAGTATWLTGGGYDERRISAGGVSVDQFAAKQLDEQTLLPSLELSVKGEGYFTGNLPRNCISWKNSHTPLSRETEPRAVFDRMFRTSSGAGIDNSVVDLVLENAKQLRRTGSHQDKRKIDEYLESIRSIEKRLKFAETRTQQAIKAGDLTNTLTRPRAGIPSDHAEYMKLMLDMLFLAFWSDATRVCTLMMDHGQSNRYFDFIDGCKGTWHALSHYRDISGRTEDDDGKTSWSSVKSKREMYNSVTQWHHQQLAYLLKKMKSVTEPDGNTLLDNSTICYGSSISDGNSHGEHNLPLLIAGGGGGAIRSGRILKQKRPTSMSKIHLAVLRTVGVKTRKFGETTRALDLS